MPTMVMTVLEDIAVLRRRAGARRQGPQVRKLLRPQHAGRFQHELLDSVADAHPAQVARVELAEKSGELVAVLRHQGHQQRRLGQTTVSSLLIHLPPPW